MAYMINDNKSLAEAEKYIFTKHGAVTVNANRTGQIGYEYDSSTPAKQPTGVMAITGLPEGLVITGFEMYASYGFVFVRNITSSNITVPKNTVKTSVMFF